MRILIAEDSATSRLLMRRAVETWGYEVAEVIDGAAAWDVLKGDDAPRLVILDWIMPGIDGVDVCRLVRRRQSQEPPYIIVVTAMDEKQNVVAGLGTDLWGRLALEVELGFGEREQVMGSLAYRF